MSAETISIVEGIQADAEGKRIVSRRVWQLAVPAIGENLLQTSLLLVDTIMIAPFGPAPLAASAIAGTLYWRAHTTFGCIEKGTAAMVARYSGEGDQEKVATAVAQSIWLAFLLGLVMSVVGVLSASTLLRWMGGEPEVVEVGTPYLQAIMCVSIARLFFLVATASLRGAGDTRSPMWITLGMNFSNIAFNFPLIYGVAALGIPALKLTGSGISTALSLLLGSLAIAWILYRGRSRFQVKPRHFRLNVNYMAKILRISGPSLIEELIITVGFLTFFHFITSFGTATLAAHSIATRIESISYMAGFGFTIASSTLVGQSLGQRNVPLARMSFQLSTKYCVMLMSVIAVGLIVFGKVIVNTFTWGDEAVSAIALPLLIIAAVEQPLLGAAMSMGGGLRGAGDTFRPMLTSLVGNAMVRVGACYVLAFPMGLGIYGIYIGTLIDWLVRTLMLLYFYRQGRWAHVRI